MKIARRVTSGILVMAVVSVSRASGGAGTTPLDRVPPTIRETQMTVQMTVRKSHIVQFQATVIDKRDRTLTLLTAAHCLAPADMGHAIELVRGEESLVGRIAAVWQNPSYHPVRSRDPRDPSFRDIVGVDNAIVTVAVEPGSEAKERLLRQIKTAAMAERAAPVGARQIFLVHVIDQGGQEHVVRAGNHLNAKCLAWSHASYRVKRGDSAPGSSSSGRPRRGKRCRSSSATSPSPTTAAGSLPSSIAEIAGSRRPSPARSPRRGRRERACPPG